MKKVKKIFDDICDLSVIELGELINLAEKKFGSLDFQFNSTGKKEEKTEEKRKDLVLNKCGQNRIPVIKLIKEITNKSLLESKKILDELPKLILKDLDYNIFEEYKKKFEDLECIVK